MNLSTLLKMFSDYQCRKVYVKSLSANDNSKNQVYLGGNFEVVNILPIKDIYSDNDGDWKRTRFKSKIDFSWLNTDGSSSPASDAQLILYPKYPEVRFSGFLNRVRNAPSDLMANRIEGRVLFLGVTVDRRIIGFVVGPESEIANEFNALKEVPIVGVFKEITIEAGRVELNSKEKLLQELRRIYNLGWIDARRLNAKAETLPCMAPNCGGYTLEAELGITPNGYAEPDYLGWEVKQFSVKSFEKYQSSIITLMTPEPTHGFYVESGIEPFIRKYGYDDKHGREARMNFGGVYKLGRTVAATNLTLIVSGFDSEVNKITNAGGFIGLLDSKDELAASWSFSSLIQHWNKKHANACYVPSMNRKSVELYPFSFQQYRYGNNVIMGTGTDFSLFLKELCKGNIYYDPGIKLELAIANLRGQSIKRRSQFRIKSRNLTQIYNQNEIVAVDE